jgi:hypothetical protein
MKFSCILNWKERKKENIVYVNNDSLIIVVNIKKFNLTMKKKIPEKLTREGKSLAFYTAVNKAEP